MTCDPALAVVCTGDSGTDPYAGCNGVWADTWALGLYYHQVCLGYDDSINVWVCPGAGEHSPGCKLL